MNDKKITKIPMLKYRYDIRDRNIDIMTNILEVDFKKHPEGFFKFMVPAPSSALYSQGTSWIEQMGLSRISVLVYLNQVSALYRSFTIYTKDQAKKNFDMFQGMPYLRYRNHKAECTFYIKNYKFEEKY